MADDWEDWENDDYQPVVAVKQPATKEFETAGQALLASAVEPDQAKFQAEDAELEEEEKHVVQKSQPKKEKKTDKYKESTKGAVVDDGPLDDPVAEKLRQQRLVEESDFSSTRDLFGDVPTKTLESLLPKSLKDFEEYAELLCQKYLLPHQQNKNYKALLKAVVKTALGPLTSQEVKDIETSAAGVRSDKFKAEQAAKKGTKKATLNVGRGGGSAGLDDLVYDEPLDDEYDFM